MLSQEAQIQISKVMPGYSIHKENPLNRGKRIRGGFTDFNGYIGIETITNY